MVTLTIEPNGNRVVEGTPDEIARVLSFQVSIPGALQTKTKAKTGELRAKLLPIARKIGLTNKPEDFYHKLVDAARVEGIKGLIPLPTAKGIWNELTKEKGPSK